MDEKNRNAKVDFRLLNIGYFNSAIVLKSWLKLIKVLKTLLKLLKTHLKIGDYVMLDFQSVV